MEIIIAILLPIIILILSFSLVYYTTHIDMTKSRTKIYGYGTYSKFLREFNKYNWQQGDYFESSLFDGKNNCQIHASIIEFDGIGMIMRTPLDYFLAVMFVRRYIKQLGKIKLYQW